LIHLDLRQDHSKQTTHLNYFVCNIVSQLREIITALVYWGELKVTKDKDYKLLRFLQTMGNPILLYAQMRQEIGLINIAGLVA